MRSGRSFELPPTTTVPRDQRFPVTSHFGSAPADSTATMMSGPDRSTISAAESANRGGPAERVLLSIKVPVRDLDRSRAWYERTLGYRVEIEFPDDDELDRWVSVLDDLAVDHSPKIDATVGWMIVIHDPDGFEIHLSSRRAHGLDQHARPGDGRVPDGV